MNFPIVEILNFVISFLQTVSSNGCNMVVNVVFVVILMEPHLVIMKLPEADMPMELLSENIGKKYASKR